MGSPIPDRDVRFAQLAVQLGFCQSDQVRGSLEEYRKYQAAGGETPSIPRILVQQGHMSRPHAEILLRHLIRGEPLPQMAAPAPAPVAQPQPIAAPQPPAPVSAALEPDPRTSSGVQEVPNLVSEEDDRETLLKGLGATVLRGEIKGYKILEVIGEGSMGVVYRAHQISMDRGVALKVLPASKTKDQRFVERFLTEARNAGRLNHPNLIRVHEVGKSGDLYYYSMEYVEGLTLGELMDEFEGGRLDAKRVVSVFTQVTAALDHGFRMGIIHREIRPNAIMITEGDQAKLHDLGLTKDEGSRFLEGENAYYVSPEQAKGAEADTRSDLYSLGCCVYHALTGEPPFQGGGPKEILGRRLLTEPPDPSEVNTDVPVELAAICMKMMARDPNNRFQTPAELMEAMRQVTLASPAATQRATTRGGAGVAPRAPAGRRPRARARGAAGTARGRTGRRRFRR